MIILNSPPKIKSLISCNTFYLVLSELQQYFPVRCSEEEVQRTKMWIWIAVQYGTGVNVLGYFS